MPRTTVPTAPAQPLPLVLGIVAASDIHAREVKADVRRELLTVGAQAAEFVGWLYRDGPWQLPPLVQAEIAQQEARGLAMTGESSAAVDAKLNEAWEIFTAAEATMSKFGCHYDRALLTMQTAICYCEAGRPGQAAQLYREHLDDEQISRRDRGYFLSLMASALAHAAKPDSAASAGHEALTIAVETHSLRTIHELKRACALLAPPSSRVTPPPCTRTAA